jgi:hypothetical protein
VAVASLRPARGQRSAARFAPNETLQRKVRTRSFAWARDLDASLKNCLNAVEGFLADKRLEVATARDPEFRHVNQARVQPIGEHSAETLGIHREAATCAQAEARDGIKHFLFGEPAGRELLEGPRHQRAAFRVGNEALS